MIYQDNFSNCDNTPCRLVYTQSKVPIFQNKVYNTREEALSAAIGEVELVQSSISGFIFNRKFNPSIMNYDASYQNEQSNSGSFRSHLSNVLKLLKSFGIQNKKVIEVGCGKGIFFDMLLSEKVDCIGFDPTYEGSNDRIIKDYYSEAYKEINADVIIMRHTLEHIPNPFSFLHTIASANSYKGYFFIEVPTFDWIYAKNSFWDIFYEHCNYFTEPSLSGMFEEATTGSFFNGQYIYLWAPLSKLRRTIPQLSFQPKTQLSFDRVFNNYKDFLTKTNSLAIWGAGAKGSTFLNLLDPKRKFVEYVIDINPAKQNKFIAGTGHEIISPAMFANKPVKNILIMNENYVDEIKQDMKTFDVNISCL